MSNMEYGSRLHWKQGPDLLINDEPLVEVILKLQRQVQAIEENELLKGTTLPPWLLQALTNVASNVDVIVECQSLRGDFSFMQKEIQDLKHELLMQQSLSGNFSPTPHHRASLTSSPSKRTLQRKSSSSGRAHDNNILSSVFMAAAQEASANGNGSESPGKDESGNVISASMVASAFSQGGAVSIMIDKALKPVWDAMHKQTNELSSMRESCNEARDTVARLQAEIKRRDAVVHARNSKHEVTIQKQLEKLNEAMRSCVTRNDLISSEQQIRQQLKQEHDHFDAQLHKTSDQMNEQFLNSRADQEDVNSSTAEHIQALSRKLVRLDDLVNGLSRQQDAVNEDMEKAKAELMDMHDSVVSSSSDIVSMQNKLEDFENQQSELHQLSKTVIDGFVEQDDKRNKSEEKVLLTLDENIKSVRNDLLALNSKVMEIVNLNLDAEFHTVLSKVEVVTLNVNDCSRKIAVLQKQTSSFEDDSKGQLTQAFATIEKILGNISMLSEESMRLAYNLHDAVEANSSLADETRKYRQQTDSTLEAHQRQSDALREDLAKQSRTMDNEITNVKNQLFSVEDATTNVSRAMEETKQDLNRTLDHVNDENVTMRRLVSELFVSRDQMTQRQDLFVSQMEKLQEENRNEIMASTNKLVAIVDKESDRVEALYRSFMEKQEQFADVVARSSVRNMDLNDLTKEMDRICESFVQECWKFETSSRTTQRTNRGNVVLENNSSSSGGGTNGSNAATQRKLFNERQQHIIVRNCQFMADLLVARAEYETLHGACQKELKQQVDMDTKMIELQTTLLEKIELKIKTKIMNNKNIGEQFDKGALERRELFIETINNMFLASLKRRTESFEEHNGSRPGFSRDFGAGGFVESHRLLPTAVVPSQAAINKRMTSRSLLAGPSTTDLESNNRTISLGIGVSAVTTGGGKIPVNQRASTNCLPVAAISVSSPSFSSHNKDFVYHAGFRLPKATPPSPPGSGRLPLTPSSTENTEPTLDESFQGWAIDGERKSGAEAEDEEEEAIDSNVQQTTEGSSGAMNKSISLPLLQRQQLG